jgi:hypothetical protein
MVYKEIFMVIPLECVCIEKLQRDNNDVNIVFEVFLTYFKADSYNKDQRFSKSKNMMVECIKDLKINNKSIDIVYGNNTRM